MSTSPASTTKDGSSHGSESSGFRSFWKKTDRTSQSQNVTFVQQDPSNKKKPNRISRMLHHGSTGSSQDDTEEGGPSSAQKRRQQVYQAQKRHRNRKQEYVQTLEAEVARLQHLDAMVNSERNTLAHQNEAMKSLLASHSLDSHLDSFSLGSSSQSNNELSLLGSAAVGIRFDEHIGQERVFLDWPDDMAWTSDDTSTEGQTQQSLRAQRHPPVTGDSWAALDFILALEWPCKDHIKHHSINPNAKTPEACDVGKFHGHALVTTAAVFSSAMPPEPKSASTNVTSLSSPYQHGLHPSSMHKWQMPHSEIDKLVELSEALELDEESMTPAQAYSAIRETVPSDKFLRPTLEALKKPLASLVQCHGFGACMDTAMFWQHLDGTIQTLQFTRAELAQ